MNTQNSSKNAVLVDLPPEPKMRDKIRAVFESFHNRAGCDVVMDFSSVDIMATPSISGLLGLRKLLVDSGHRLILRNVASATRGIFTVTGLDAVFDLAEDTLVDSAVLNP
ncbi:MAG: STAS domain-containing protein [Planctomycetota bacterium]|nr:MAG: STAS domain-containing protein [Planctomycetota bacterium]